MLHLRVVFLNVPFVMLYQTVSTQCSAVAVTVILQLYPVDELSQKTSSLHRLLAGVNRKRTNKDHKYCRDVSPVGWEWGKRKSMEMGMGMGMGWDGVVERVDKRNAEMQTTQLIQQRGLFNMRELMLLDLLRRREAKRGESPSKP